MLITTWAVHHLAIAPLGMIAGDNFQAVDLQARYRDLYLFYVYGFSALTLLVGRQEGHPACKKTEQWVLVWLSVWSEVQTCIWPS